MRQTQRDKLRIYFKQNPMRFIPLYEIRPFAAQYGTRISELRWGEDMCIVSVPNGRIAGQRHTGFVYDPTKSWHKEQGRDHHTEEQLTFN